MNSKSLPIKNNAVAVAVAVAKYLVVAVKSGMTSEDNYFNSLTEAQRAFGEIAHDYGYKPSEINSSDKYDVSIWEWTEDRYEKAF